MVKSLIGALIAVGLLAYTFANLIAAALAPLTLALQGLPIH